MNASVGVETVDHPNHAQLVAYAQKYFRDQTPWRKPNEGGEV